MPTVSIVIPTHRPRCLENTVDALARQSSSEFEVIIVENGERSDRTLEVLNRYRKAMAVSYRFIPQCGLNRARNRGVQACRAPIIALLDDDCIPERDWIMGIVNAHGRFPGVGVIGGRVLLTFEEPRPDWLCDHFRRQLSELDLGPGERVLRNEYLVGANLSFRRRTYDAVGGFNENIGMVGRNGPQLCNDELDFVQRARAFGNPGVVYDGRACVHHVIPAQRTTIEYFENRAFGQGLSDVVLREQTQHHLYPLQQLLIEKLHVQTGHWVRLNEVVAGLRSTSRGAYRQHYARCRLAYLEGMIHRLDHIEDEAPAGRCSKKRMLRRGFQAVMNLNRRANRFSGYDRLAGRLQKWSVGPAGSTARLGDYETARARVFYLVGMRAALRQLENSKVHTRRGGNNEIESRESGVV